MHAQKSERSGLSITCVVVEGTRVKEITQKTWETGVDETIISMINFFEILYQFLCLSSVGSLSLDFFFLNLVLIVESDCSRTFSA